MLSDALALLKKNAANAARFKLPVALRGMSLQYMLFLAK